MATDRCGILILEENMMSLIDRKNAWQNIQVFIQRSGIFPPDWAYEYYHIFAE
jgi:hypothetical protein